MSMSDLLQLKYFDRSHRRAVGVVVDLSQGKEMSVLVAQADAGAEGQGGVYLLLVYLAARAAQPLEKFGQADLWQRLKQRLNGEQLLLRLVGGQLLQLLYCDGVCEVVVRHHFTPQACHNAAASQGRADVSAQSADISSG